MLNGCSSLQEVIIPENVSEIDHWAFASCTGVKRISIPSSVTQIHTGAMGGCKNLIRLEVHIDSLSKIRNLLYRAGVERKWQITQSVPVGTELSLSNNDNYRFFFRFKKIVADLDP